MLFAPNISRKLLLPLFSSKVTAGFPSPAEDHIEQTLDLNDLLINNPSATFYLRVTGHAMVQAGILDGDVLVVDRSIKARHNAIIVAEVNTDFLVRRFLVSPEGITLATDSEIHDGVHIDPRDDLFVFGTVTGVVRRLT